MNKRKCSIFFVLAALLMACLSASGQTSGSNSPYSRYGWGTLSDEAMGFNKAMSGVALGLRDPGIINRQNPAAYSAVDSITLLFDVGVSLQTSQFKADSKSVNAQNSTLDYLAAAFRLSRGLGFSFGLRPFSVVGYDFNSQEEMDDIDGFGEKTTTAAYHGEGGFRQLWAGLGWRPLKPLSVGMNLNYTWGDYNHFSSVSYSDQNVLTLSRTYKANINALTVDFGLQYQQKIGKKDVVTLGATYALGNEIDQRATFINSQSGTNASVNADTVVLPNAFRLPSMVGVGLAWNHGGQWTVAADYTIQFWENARFPSLRRGAYRIYNGTLRNRHKISAGVEFIPKPRGQKTSDHIAYRAGFSYSTPYTKINYQDGARSILLSAGASIPLVNKYNSRISAINLSGQWEHVDSKALGAVKEDYLRLCVGFTLNATWFNKWKFE